MPEVICMGPVVADVIVRPFDRLPEKGKVSLVDQLELHLGGCALNPAIDLAKLGVGVGIIGKVGNDGFGRFILQEIEKNGIDSGGIKISESDGTSATAVIVSSDGERSLVRYYGTDNTFSLDDIDWELIESTKVLHIGGVFMLPSLDGEPTVEILKKAKEWGITTSIGTAWSLRGCPFELIKDYFNYTDIFISNYEEAESITGKSSIDEIADAFLSYSAKRTVITLGGEGCYICTPDMRKQISPFKVKLVDATGAGDAFIAGFLTGVVKGWDLEKTAIFANAVGSLCVTSVGATTGIKSLEETLRYIKSSHSSDIP